MTESALNFTELTQFLCRHCTFGGDICGIFEVLLKYILPAPKGIAGISSLESIQGLKSF
jgi:hypothetical protein